MINNKGIQENSSHRESNELKLNQFNQIQAQLTDQFPRSDQTGLKTNQLSLENSSKNINIRHSVIKLILIGSFIIIGIVFVLSFSTQTLKGKENIPKKNQLNKYLSYDEQVQIQPQIKESLSQNVQKDDKNDTQIAKTVQKPQLQKQENQQIQKMSENIKQETQSIKQMDSDKNNTHKQSTITNQKQSSDKNDLESIYRIHEKVEIIQPAIPLKQNLNQTLWQQFENKEVKGQMTAIFTTSGRPEFLQQTLQSFFLFNTYNLQKIIIVQDGEKYENLEKLMKKYQNITWIITNKKVGQFSSVKTKKVRF